jgi:hypothetical protein
VFHTCCELRDPGKQSSDSVSIPRHTGNDCFVYELPDGTSAPVPELILPINNVTETRIASNVDDYTVIKASDDSSPFQFQQQQEGGKNSYSGYRMRLYLLKNKSPPTLVVKAIERGS